MRARAYKRTGLNLLEFLFALSCILGAIAGATHGWRDFGIVGVILGIPTGAILGPLFLYVLPVFAILALCSIPVYRKGGWRGVKRFWCGEGPKPGDPRGACEAAGEP